MNIREVRLNVFYGEHMWHREWWVVYRISLDGATHVKMLPDA